jgi:multidrug efflux pump
MLSRFFVDRPIFAWVLSVVIVLAGGICVFQLPIAQYPPIVPPNIQVTCNYPGASAKTLADTVAMPIEEQVVGLEGMIYQSSTCANNGSYTLNVTFTQGSDIHTALLLVQTRVQLAMPQLPPEVQQEGITVRMQSPNILLVVNLLSDTNPETGQDYYDQLFISNYAQINIYDELSSLPGVSLVNFLGQRQYSMRVWLDPQKLASLDITASDVVNAIKEQNIPVPAGNIGQQPVPKGQQYQLALNTMGRLSRPDQFGAIVIKVGKNGKVVYLRDVVVAAEKDAKGHIIPGTEGIAWGAQNYDLNCTVGQKPSIGLAVFQLPQANALDTAAATRQLMTRLEKQFPRGLHWEINYDTTPYIRHSVDDVINTIIIAAILVIIVVLVFLQDWRAMLLPMIDIVVALIGTFILMAALGFSLNNLSLFGLVLAVGIVVDDSIVVVENIERWMGRGLAAREATIKAMDEITGPVIGITLVLSSVFIPAALIPGLSGQFFRQFALTIASSAIISATNALTMAPARAVAWIKPHTPGAEHEVLPRVAYVALLGGLAYLLAGTLARKAGLTGDAFWAARGGGALAAGICGWFLARRLDRWLGTFFKGFNWAFDHFANGYTRLIGLALRLSLIVLLLYGGLLALTYYGFASSPTGLIPEQDEGYLIVAIELPDSASVQRTSDVVARATKICLETPGVKITTGVAGYSVLYTCDSSNWGTIFVVLKDFEERTTAETQAKYIVRELNRRFNEEIIDARVNAMMPPAVPGLGQGGGFQLQIEDNSGLGLEALQQVTDAVIDKANQQPGLRRVFTSFRARTPALYVDIDRENAKEMGVSLDDVFTTLNVNVGSAYVNLMNEYGRIWQVNVQAAGPYRANAEQLKWLYVRNKDGQSVPLAALIRVRDDVGPVFVMRYNDRNSSAILGQAAPGYSSGQAISLMEQLCNEQLPRGMSYEWTNIAYQEVTAGNTGILVFVAAVVLIFLVLAALYESWRLPMAIILVVPMCLLCSIAGLVWIMGMDVNIFSQIGFVVLVALAAKNAILIVEYARDENAKGLSQREAVLEACRLRLRPILMTSFAFIFGVWPLVIATGAGFEMRRALGTAVFSGMIGVTFFGLLLTPVFYFVLTWFDKAKPVPPTPAPSPDGPAATETAIQEKPHPTG